MKKSLIALAALAATTAFAQSSVTISGQLDTGISSQESGSGATKSTQTVMNTGIHGASRLRFVGTEDMGGGNKANFWLEMQPNFQTGSTAADLFQLVEGVTSSSSIGFVTSALNNGISAGLTALE